MDQVTPMTAKKTMVQLFFQIFDPVIIINHLRRYQMQIDLSVDDLTKNNIHDRNNTALISLLNKQIFLTGIFHGTQKPLHHLFKILFFDRLYQIVIGLYLKGLKYHFLQNRYKDQNPFKLAAAQLPCCLHAVDPLHLDIQKQNIDLLIIFQQFFSTRKLQNDNLYIFFPEKTRHHCPYRI